MSGIDIFFYVVYPLFSLLVVLFLVLGVRNVR